jgi:hypothetical protein
VPYCRPALRGLVPTLWRLFVGRFLDPLRTRAGVSLFCGADFSEVTRAPKIGGQRAGEPELGVSGDHQPCPSGGCLRAAKPGLGPPERLLEQAKRAIQIESAEERLPTAVDVPRGGGGRPPQQRGLFTPPLGNFHTTRRMTFPSMMGSRPSWSIQAAPPGQPGCSRSQVCAVALAVGAGAGDGHGLLGVPGGGVAEDELAAVREQSAALGRPCRTGP